MFAALFKKASPWDMFEEGKKSWQDFNAREQEAIIRNYIPKVRYLAQKQKRMDAPRSTGPRAGLCTMATALQTRTSRGRKNRTKT